MSMSTQQLPSNIYQHFIICIALSCKFQFISFNCEPKLPSVPILLIVHHAGMYMIKHGHPLTSESMTWYVWHQYHDQNGAVNWHDFWVIYCLLSYWIMGQFHFTIYALFVKIHVPFCSHPNIYEVITTVFSHDTAAQLLCHVKNL